MAYMPKPSCIAGACALLFLTLGAAAQTETQLSPVVITGQNEIPLANSQIQWGLGGSWKDKPQSVSSISREQMDAQINTKVSDVITNDASVQRNYTALGYYEFFAIRGFPLDTATAYKLNGMTVAGEANFPLENKERVEIIKGITALESGIVSPGGQINFVTKRPDQNLKSIGIGLGEKGTFSQFADYSHALTFDQPIGFRINAAHEDYHPYVTSAKGYRDFFSLALDTRLSSGSKLETDFDYQKKSQYSVPGYQLLGDNGIPPIDPYRHLTAEQTWAKPVITNQLNAGFRLTQDINSDWKSLVAYQYSQIKTDDNSAFPWGGNSGLYSNHFTSAGRFNIYDYRSHDEFRKNQEFKVELKGDIKHSEFAHKVQLGTSVSTREINQPKYLYNCAGTSCSYGSIYGNSSVLSLNSGSQTPYFHYENIQKSFYVYDSVESKKYLGNLKLGVGARYVSLEEDWKNYLYDRSSSPNKNVLLPTLSVNLPQGQHNSYLMYGQGLEIGSIAPIIATNAANQLPPRMTTQYEVGHKYVHNNRLQLGVSAYQISKSYEYVQQSGGSYGADVQAGKEIHRGIEASAAGVLTSRTNIQASVALITTDIQGTHDIYDGKQAPNVPKLSANIFANHKIPEYEGLAVNSTLRYVGSRFANRENTARIPSYARLDLGATKTVKTSMGLTTYQLSVENVFDHRYWADTPEWLGDAYLIPGAPRIFRATAKLEF